MNRRNFITLLGGAAAWPLAARAQQPVRMRRIGVLLAGEENDPLWKRRLSTFAQALADLGWTDGRNMRMDLRWWGDDINRIQAMRRTRSPCCAPAASGQAAAPPRKVMNSRRRIIRLSR